MKVLWFSLSPCGSMKRTNSTKFTQTWMTTLEDGIKNQNDIDLSVAYYCDASSYEPPFDYEGVHYYPIISRGGGGLNKIRERFVSLEKQDTILIKRALDVVSKVKPDIIHVHGTESNFGLIVDYVNNIPIVISLQGIISPITERYYAGIPKNVAKSCDTYGDYLHNIYEDKVYNWYRYAAFREQHVLRNATHILGRTSWDYQVVHMMSPDAKYSVVNEIIRKDFHQSKWNKEKYGDPFTIVSTLSNGVYKGYEVILKTAEILKKYASFDFKWEVIGCDERYKYVKGAIKLTGVNPSEVNVHFQGRKLVGEMIPLMVNADLYVQTSHIENSPNALCEALTLGMPCLASNVGGTSSMLRDGIDGKLYSSGDSYALASLISEAHAEFDHFSSMGRIAREVSLRRFSSDNVVCELKNVYKELSNSKNGL